MERYELYSPGNGAAAAVRAVGYSEHMAVTRYRGIRENLILHYCLRGKGYYNGTPVRAGEGFVIHPNEMAEYGPDADDPWAFLWLIFNGAAFSEYLPLLPEQRGGVFRFPFLRDMENLCCRICEKVAAGGGPSLFPLAAAAEIFALHEESRKKPDRPMAAEYASLARAYIEVNYAEKDLSVSLLCRRLGVSQPYLYRVFVGQYGHSPKAWIEEVREARARELLHATSLPVCSVAEAVGFADPLAFSAFFRRRTGLSPRAFRQAKRPPSGP